MRAGLRALALAVACSVGAGELTSPQDQFECYLRQLAVEYAARVQPFRPLATFSQLADALAAGDQSHGADCDVHGALRFAPESAARAPRLLARPPAPRRVADGATIFVSPGGSDSSGDGSEDAPFASPARALQASRAAPSGGPNTIILRQGVYFVPTALVLTPQDSGLTIQSMPGEEAWLSGAQPLVNVSWRAVNITPPSNLWAASLAGLGVASAPGLRINGERLIRARFPNNESPERIGFGPSISRGLVWTPQVGPALPAVDIILNRSVVSRNDTLNAWQAFAIGIGGTCDNFVPNAGFWCSAGSGGQGVYQVPSAVAVPPEQAPRTPYADPTGMLVQTWKPGHWASWTFEATAQQRGFNGTNATNYLLRGGFQGSRGDTQGEATYIENVFEELDAPGEYFYNESTQTLYLWHNDTSGTPPPSDGSLAVTVNRWIVNISGTMAAPVRDVSLIGLGLRDTASTNMDNHSMPSSGDWALPRSAVVFIEGSERTSVAGCVFERVDGNAVMLSAYNRNASIEMNEFAWIGASAVVVWGNAFGGDPRIPYGMGFDGSSGDQPRGSLIAHNVMREIGVFVKQSSALTTFVSSENSFVENLVWNGPRAHVNVNEGFRGGNLIEGNVLVNSCRESGDHGPVNLWNRNPYLFDRVGGAPGELTVYKANDTVRRNLVIGNYATLSCVDSDDGTCYLDVVGNVLLSGQIGMKGWQQGHDVAWRDNLVAWPRGPWPQMAQSGYGSPLNSVLEGHEYIFTGNTAVLSQFGAIPRDYVGTQGMCLPNATGRAVTANNTVFWDLRDTNATECGLKVEAYQAEYGGDPGTVAAPYNATRDDGLANRLIGVARQLLFAALAM